MNCGVKLKGIEKGDLGNLQLRLQMETTWSQSTLKNILRTPVETGVDNG